MASIFDKLNPEPLIPDQLVAPTPAPEQPEPAPTPAPTPTPAPASGMEVSLDDLNANLVEVKTPNVHAPANEKDITFPPPPLPGATEAEQLRYFIDKCNLAVESITHGRNCITELNRFLKMNPETVELMLPEDIQVATKIMQNLTVRSMQAGVAKKKTTVAKATKKETTAKAVGDVFAGLDI